MTKFIKLHSSGANGAPVYINLETLERFEALEVATRNGGNTVVHSAGVPVVVTEKVDTVRDIINRAIDLGREGA